MAGKYVPVSSTTVRKRLLDAIVKNNVQPGSAVYTDTLPSYNDLDMAYEHKMADHAIEYVNGRVHTNGLENFWSLLKRGIKGTYVAVAPFHLFRYLDEQTFRYNQRKADDFSRFWAALSKIVNRRITYNLNPAHSESRQVIAKPE